MIIPWDFYQILDRDLLFERPVESLLLLHAQPPLLNTALAGLLAIARATEMPIEPLALWVNVGLLALCAAMLYRLAEMLTVSRLLAAAAVAMLLCDPAAHFHTYLFFYELPALAGQAAVALFAALWLHRFRLWTLYALVLALGYCALLRTLYGPLWAVAVFAVIVVLGKVHRPAGRRVRWRGALGPALVLVILLSLWPVKNFLFFGSLTNSSWVGFNLCRGPKLRDARLQRFLDDGIATRQPGETYSRPLIYSPQPDNALTRGDRIDGSRNWNHWVFLAVDGDLRRQAFEHWKTHPWQWLDKARSYYLRWGRACATDSYTEAPLFVPQPVRPGYLAFARTYSAVLHFNLRSLFSTDRKVNETPGRRPKTSWPIYSVVTLPAILILTFAAIRRQGLRSGWRVQMRLVLTVMAILPMLFVCFTDGAEGNRMRYSTIAATILLLLMIVGDIVAWWHRRHDDRMARPRAA
jgi:hypothetical protein